MGDGASSGVAWTGALILFGVWLVILSLSPPLGLMLALLIFVLAIFK